MVCRLGFLVSPRGALRNRLERVQGIQRGTTTVGILFAQEFVGADAWRRWYSTETPTHRQKGRLSHWLCFKNSTEHQTTFRRPVPVGEGAWLLDHSHSPSPLRSQRSVKSPVQWAELPTVRQTGGSTFVRETRHGEVL